MHFLQVQDEAAGLVVSLLDPQPGESILDACAAPGGKALFIAARMKNQVQPILGSTSPATFVQERAEVDWQQKRLQLLCHSLCMIQCGPQLCL